MGYYTTEREGYLMLAVVLAMVAFVGIGARADHKQDVARCSAQAAEYNVVSDCDKSYERRALYQAVIKARNDELAKRINEAM